MIAIVFLARVRVLVSAPCTGTWCLFCSESRFQINSRWKLVKWPGLASDGYREMESRFLCAVRKTLVSSLSGRACWLACFLALVYLACGSRGEAPLSIGNTPPFVRTLIVIVQRSFSCLISGQGQVGKPFQLLDSILRSRGSRARTP